ncbi:MAG: hypothetical protein ABWK05_02250 [Pyrobaculum sp.]
MRHLVSQRLGADPGGLPLRRLPLTTWSLKACPAARSRKWSS